MMTFQDLADFFETVAADPRLGPMDPRAMSARFFAEKALERHVECGALHPNLTEDGSSTGRDDANPRDVVFACPECGREFKSSQALGQHGRMTGHNAAIELSAAGANR